MTAGPGSVMPVGSREGSTGGPEPASAASWAASPTKRLISMAFPAMPDTLLVAEYCQKVHDGQPSVGGLTVP